MLLVNLNKVLWQNGPSCGKMNFGYDVAKLSVTSTFKMFVSCPNFFYFTYSIPWTTCTAYHMCVFRSCLCVSLAWILTRIRIWACSYYHKLLPLQKIKVEKVSKVWSLFCVIYKYDESLLRSYGLYWWFFLNDDVGDVFKYANPIQCRIIFLNKYEKHRKTYAAEVIHKSLGLRSFWIFSSIGSVIKTSKNDHNIAQKDKDTYGETCPILKLDAIHSAITKKSCFVSMKTTYLTYKYSTKK